jgi:hypothetical protein
MVVEHLEPALVQDVAERVARARRRASEQVPEARDHADDPDYWQRVFEANAEALLGALERVRLAAGNAVRYRFYGRRGTDFLVRPFVARLGTDVGAVLRVLDWHAAPDSVRATDPAASRDVELLYRHFQFEPSAAGVFEYWVAMQELWASQRWIHSTVIADAEQFAQITAAPDWHVERPVERVEPAVIQDGEVRQIAVLLHCPLERHLVTFHRVRIAADQSVEFAESILVAHGPRGYLT